MLSNPVVSLFLKNYFRYRCPLFSKLLSSTSRTFCQIFKLHPEIFGFSTFLGPPLFLSKRDIQRHTFDASRHELNKVCFVSTVSYEHHITEKTSCSTRNRHV